MAQAVAWVFRYLIAAVMALSLTACSDEKPRSYGVYAFDHGKYIELLQSLPDGARLDLSRDVKFLIFDRRASITPSFTDSTNFDIRDRTFVRYEIQFGTAKPNETDFSQYSGGQRVHVEPDPDNRDMISVVPTGLLTRGLYSLHFSGADYPFAVDMGAAANQQHEGQLCEDRYIENGTTHYEPCSDWDSHGSALVPVLPAPH